MQDCETYFAAAQLLHVALDNLSKDGTDLSHDLDEGIAPLVNLELVLLQQAVKSDTTGKNAPIIARL